MQIINVTVFVNLTSGDGGLAERPPVLGGGVEVALGGRLLLGAGREARLGLGHVFVSCVIYFLLCL